MVESLLSRMDMASCTVWKTPEWCPIGIQHPASMTGSYPITNFGVRDRLWARDACGYRVIFCAGFLETLPRVFNSLRDIISRIN